MDLRAIDTFIAVARAGSFAAVARVRGLDPSAISRTIAGLEEALGVRLFQRSTRRLALTEAGRRYLEQAEAPLAALTEAAAAARAEGGAVAGTLRLATSVAFGQAWLVPRLSAIRAALPAVRLELLFNDATQDLVAERIDLAIRLGPSYRADVIGTKLFATGYQVVASPAYLATAPALAEPEHLAAHGCLRFDLPEFRSQWRCRRGGKSVVVAVDGPIVASNALALRDAALAGLGPALLPDWLVGEALRDGALVDCLPGWSVAAASFETAAWLLYPSRALLPAKVRAMIDVLRTLAKVPEGALSAPRFAGTAGL